MKKRTTAVENYNSSNQTLLKELEWLSQQISSYSNHSLTRVEFLDKSLRMLIQIVGCDEIELWIPDMNIQNNNEIIKQTHDSFSFKIGSLLTDEWEPGQVSPAHDSAYNQLCMDIINGAIHPPHPFMTEKGTVWMNEPEMNNTTDEVFKKYFTQRLKSFIIVPLMNDKLCTGLFQLKGGERDFFNKDKIELFENFAHTFGMALLNQRAQAALRERVKELTCMYGIAQAARAGVSIKEIMNNAVLLLPQAWQYPHIAHSKIELNGDIYTTPGYHDGQYKQRADIIVKNKICGFVELLYTEKRIEIYEGPFLKEERNLIDNIAKALSTIVEQKQAEEDKQKLQLQIRHADRLATIGQLSAGIAHELNEPLGNILGFAQLLIKNIDLPNQISHDIERIIDSSLHAREIVKKLLIFARQMPAKKIHVCLNNIVHEGIYFLESRCIKAGITLTLLLEKNLPEIIADPAQMTQVLVNLVVNAIQAMPAGGELTVQTSTKDDHITLVVEDRGSGISPGDMKQIFLPFFTTKEIGQGTGLGLAVVHGIVTSHGGSITVQSEVNRGSRFEIRLPKIKSNSQNKEKQNEAAIGK